MLGANHPEGDVQPMMPRPRFPLAAALLIVAVVLIASCAANPVTGRQDFMLISEPEEIEMGKKVDASVTREYGLYNDPRLTAYVADMGRRLGRLSHRPQLDYSVKVLDSPVVNAFAAPGGYLFFTRGILATLNSEAELAGVMGHEIGHVTARHSAQQLSKAQVAQIGLIIPQALGVPLLSSLAQVGMGLFFMKYSRDNEREADSLSVEYATKAGYDASQMAGFFETLQRMNPQSDKSGMPAWFSTHPSPEDREQAIKTQAQQVQRQMGLTRPRIEREAYLRAIDGIVYGQDPREGYAEGGMYYHPAMRIQFPVPADWKVNDTPTAVQMANKEKSAVILFTGAQGKSPEEAARTFVSKTRARVIQSQPARVGGFAAYRLVADVQSGGSTIRTLTYFIRKGDGLYSFTGFSTQKNFPQHENLFENTLSRFAELTDARRINVQPDRVRVRRTARADTLGNALRSLGVPENKIKETALLNGGAPEEPVPPHTLLKVIERVR
jgi:predicted Zn-dependent protease